MKRILSLTLSLALVALAANAGLARDVVKDTRVNFQYYAPSVTEVPAANTREDTLFLFASSGPGAYGMPGTNARGYTFDNGSGGPATAGWTTLDLTAQAGDYWHVEALTLTNGHGTDLQSAGDFGGGTTANDYAWWCGQFDQCGWINPTGYGTSWNQDLELSLPAYTDSIRVEFDYVGDFEGDTFDFFTLFSKMGANDPVELFQNAVSGEQAVLHYSQTLTDGSDKVIFHFQSDGGWSDQDGSFITDIGAVWIDNVALFVDGVAGSAWDFDDGNEPAEFNATSPAGAGIYGALYSGLFSEDVCFTNGTYAWAFFDLNTTDPQYPIPVTAYGPPYFDNGIQSPILDRAHALDDATGVSVQSVMGPDSQVLLYWDVYRDLPLNALIFYQYYISAETVELSCPGPWANDNTVYYGDDNAWAQWNIDGTIDVATSAGPNTITGLDVRLTTVDQCGVWCNTNGDGTGHTPAPYFDNVQLMVVNTSAIAWNIDVFRRFQDNFPEAGTGKVRIDSSIDVQPTASTTLVIGDSTRIELNMDLDGGIMPDVTSVPGETRPSLYMYSRVVAGPHMGSTDPAMGDPDISDGIYSPHVGTAVVNGETWNVAIADTCRYQGTNSPGAWAFDFAEDYFEGGDIIELYYKGTSGNATTQTRPRYAESTDPLLRSYYRVRCLPTAGATMLFCDDRNAILPWWEEAFRYNGSDGYDIYSTQAPSSGLHNGLGGRAEIGDIDQYTVITWDSGDLPSYTIQNALPDDITFDDDLLDDWLNNSSHNTCLWVMGDELASDLDDEPSFLQDDLGANHLDLGGYYDDLTGIKVPTAIATHPALEINGLQPYFLVDGGCPTIDNFDLVEVNSTNPLAVEAFAWQNDGGTTAKAGIYNQDPDGNGTASSPGGHTNRALFNPFSYFQVLDAGFGVADGYSYAHRLVGDVLSNLCGFQPNTNPDGAETVPASSALKGNYPNPFNPTTTIKFALSADSQVHLNVYDLGGRLVKELVNERMAAGADHQATWDGTDNSGARVASGVYFYKLTAGDFTATDKMVMLK